jgi:hypothetical protein
MKIAKGSNHKEDHPARQPKKKMTIISQTMKNQLKLNHQPSDLQ